MHVCHFLCKPEPGLRRTLDGLTAQGNVGCDQALCNDVNCMDVHGRGRLGRHFLRSAHSHRRRLRTSTGAVSGSSLSITGAASVGLLSSRNHLTPSGAATAASFAATGALMGATLTITGPASTGRRCAAT